MSRSDALRLAECALLGAILGVVALIALQFGLAPWAVVGWASGGALVGLLAGLLVLPEGTS